MASHERSLEPDWALRGVRVPRSSVWIVAAVLLTSLAGCTGSPTASRRVAASADTAQSPPRYATSATPTLSAAASPGAPGATSATATPGAPSTAPPSATQAPGPSSGPSSGSGGGPPTAGGPGASQTPPAPSSRAGHDAGVPTRGHGPGPGAPGAPILIPARVTDMGRPLADVTAEIEAGVRQQCGGTLCLTLVHEQRANGDNTSCQFIATEPPQRTTVPRGSTVVIVSGSSPCTDSSDSTPPGAAP